MIDKTPETWIMKNIEIWCKQSRFPVFFFGTSPGPSIIGVGTPDNSGYYNFRWNGNYIVQAHSEVRISGKTNENSDTVYVEFTYEVAE